MSQYFRRLFRYMVFWVILNYNSVCDWKHSSCQDDIEYSIFLFFRGLSMPCQPHHASVLGHLCQMWILCRLWTWCTSGLLSVFTRYARLTPSQELKSLSWKLCDTNNYHRQARGIQPPNQHVLHVHLGLTRMTLEDTNVRLALAT